MDSTTEEKSMRPCNKCGNLTEHTVLLMNGKRLFDKVDPTCPACYELMELLEAEKKEAARMDSLQKGWDAICPPLYRDTDHLRPTLSPFVREALWAWKPNGVMGLALIGETGRGKTRLAFARLKELHFAGHAVFAVSAKKIERAIQDSFSDDKTEKAQARGLIWSAEAAEILLLDDIGKEKYTERVASDFYALIEERTSNLLPTIWTANTSAGELTRRMGSEHGDATVRRLMEFSTIVTV